MRTATFKFVKIKIKTKNINFDILKSFENLQNLKTFKFSNFETFEIRKYKGNSYKYLIILRIYLYLANNNPIK